MRPHDEQNWTIKRLQNAIESTVLGNEVDMDAVIRTTHEALELGVKGGVCVPPQWVRVAYRTAGGVVPVVTVADFPHGGSNPHLVAEAILEASENGADEVDVVLGRQVRDPIEAQDRMLVWADTGVRVKVILESAERSRDELAHLTRAARRAGLAFVKTSTGYSPKGGATLDAVRVMHAEGHSLIRVKASGGIRTADFALSLLDAGATRLGTSSAQQIFGELSVRGS